MRRVQQRLRQTDPVVCGHRTPVPASKYGTGKTRRKGLYVHDSSDTADLDVVGCLANLALQPILGILPKRRTGSGGCGFACPGACRPSLTAGVPGFIGHTKLVGPNCGELA